LLTIAHLQQWYIWPAERRGRDRARSPRRVSCWTASSISPRRTPIRRSGAPKTRAPGRARRRGGHRSQHGVPGQGRG